MCRFSLLNLEYIRVFDRGGCDLQRVKVSVVCSDRGADAVVGNPNLLYCDSGRAKAFF